MVSDTPVFRFMPRLILSIITNPPDNDIDIFFLKNVFFTFLNVTLCCHICNEQIVAAIYVYLTKHHLKFISILDYLMF